MTSCLPIYSNNQQAVNYVMDRSVTSVLMQQQQQQQLLQSLACPSHALISISRSILARVACEIDY